MFQKNLCLIACLFLVPAIAIAGTEALDSERARAIAFDYLEDNRGALGLGAGDLADIVVNDQYVSQHNGVTHVFLLQRYEGVEVKNAITNLAIGADGTVIHVGQRFVSNLVHKVSGAPELTAIEALGFAAAELELAAPAAVQVLEPAVGANQRSLLSGAGISHDDIPVHLVYQVVGEQVRLAWDLVIRETDDTNWWNVRIDAETGRLLDKNDFIANESYEVYELPIESPQHTAPPPPADARTVAVDPFMDSPASPFGWHDTDGAVGPEFTITRGNNVHSYADADNNGIPDTGANAEPDGGAGLDFTGAVVPIDLTMAPATYTQASIANLFYWNNIIHDVLHGYGFDEPSGNFQVNNYGNGGLGNDDVRAQSQDGGGNCNATFGTPEDGQRPIMSMFLCTNASPARDGCFDHGVVAPEYGHGWSNRLTGGPSEAGCLNNVEQMGEGWSDYIGMMLTQEVGDAGTDARGVGTYLFGQPADGPGIRAAPYSTDFGVNNFTYSRITTASVPHGVGHVWATMLWQMTWNLIDEYGFNPNFYDEWSTGGNNLAIQLVNDGMKFQPCGPGFVDGRDGILAADDALTGTGGFFTGVNQCSIWDGFAIRGLGFSADQGDPNNRADGTEAFDMPPACETIGAPIDLQNICQGDEALFRIGAGTGFTDPPVALSVTGEPGGTTTTFDPAMIATVPGISDLTIGNTGSAAAGSYTLNITGDDGTNIFMTAAELNVFATGPVDGAVLTLPADGAIDEPVVPTFTWEAVNDALSYTIEIDDDPGFGSIDYSASGIEGLTHTPSVELDFLTEYFWRVRGDNPCGSGADSAVSSFTTLRFPGDCDEGIEPNDLFLDDLENGLGDWTSSGTGNTWALSNVRFNSPVTSFYALDPVTLSDQRLISPPIVVNSSAQPTLQFSNFQAFETPNGDGRCWDAGILEVSTDDGTTWSQVPQEAMLTDPYDNIIWNDQPGNNPITNDYGATDAWCDEAQPFTDSVVDLSQWAGHEVRFAWRLGSDSAAGGEGWYVDDVKVQTCGPGDIFANGFEPGDTPWDVVMP